ncbi:MAG: GAF domain-containing protein [Thalassotalea sp.]|nr:GAF domain-containing protein [Thalassotalea sp.]
MVQSANLSVYLSNPRVSLKEKLLKICLAVKSDIPTCDRVSIWLFSADYSEMTSLMCIDEEGTKSKGEVLFAKDYGDYFEHITNQEILVASDARVNEISKCFNVGYFDVHNIHSMLDVTFLKDNSSPLGLVCCERTGTKTEWQENDVEVLKSISTKASLFISNNVFDTYFTEN